MPIGGESMYFPRIREGDILLYYRDDHGLLAVAEEAIKVGEILEDGLQQREYYHVAIALNDRHKIEALNRVVITDIVQDGSFDVFRPRIRQRDIRRGLYETRKLVGQRYDWILIIDDALRYMSGGLLHLPRKLVESHERREKICSSLAAFYLRAAKFTGGVKFYPSPQDIFLAVKDYQVR